MLNSLELLVRYSDVSASGLDLTLQTTGHRIIGHLLPMLNGLRRAVVDTAFPWKLVDPSPAGISPTAADLEHITSAATYDWDISSEEGRI